MKHCDCKSGHAVLVGMMGAGFFAISLSESIGKWRPMIVLASIIVGGFIGIWSEQVQIKRCENRKDKN